MTKPKSAIEEGTFHTASVYLASLDGDWRQLVRQVGLCTHSPKPAREPYEALIRAIAYQQLHAKAGDAILTKFVAVFGDSGFPSPDHILSMDFDSLRSCGFSGRKIETIWDIASGSLSGLVPSRKEAYKMSDNVLIARIVTIKGIGRWTVEMFLIYTMERMDVLPADDFGVREGHRRMKSLAKALSAKDIAREGQRWSPHRTIAAWYLWRVPRDETTKG
ncbi:MAG: DNA-3-methyladenine glycosylase 2 family protein [Edaphobacter sp.]